MRLVLKKSLLLSVSCMLGVPLTTTDCVAASPTAQLVVSVTLEKFVWEPSPSATDPSSQVQFVLSFPGGQKVSFPQKSADKAWTLQAGKPLEIGETLTVPPEVVHGDQFHFTLQVLRQGILLSPCEFDVAQVSQFNRTYTCHTDLNWQRNHGFSEEQLEKDTVQLRVYSNAKPSQNVSLPREPLARPN